MTGEPLPAGVDWLARWAELQRDLQTASQASRPTARADSPDDPWAARAQRFDAFTRARPEPLPEGLASRLGEGDLVVDVGAGTGRHTLLFAARCRHVYAVEPSAAMRARLALRLEEAGARNVTVLEATWPEAAPPEVDVAFSSHVVYGVHDLEAFVRAMDGRARRLCALLVGLRAPAAVLEPLRARLHARPEVRWPGALDVLGVLHQLGLPAGLEVLPERSRVLDTGQADSELDELCARLALPLGEASRRRLRDALAGTPERDGRLVLGHTTANALLAWPSALARANDRSLT